EPTISQTERGTTGRTAPALSPGAERLLHDSERHVRALADQHSLPWDPGMDNTVAAIARHAQADGLHRIDHLAVKDGQIRYASFDGVVMKEGFTPAHGAANAPAEQSLADLSRTNETAARVHEGSI